MLHAISSNKAGRSLSSREVHWRQLFSASEDSLTSSVFGSLLHLPQELFWKILNDACLNGEIKIPSLKIESVDFWPRWNAQGTNNTNHVEPDIFIRTPEVDFIVECKRYDHDQQNYFQWRNQFNSYLNEFEEDDRQVLLLAIGGLRNNNIETVESNAGKVLSIKKLSWSSILQEIKIINSRLERTRGYLNSVDSVLNILNETILAFEIHGYSAGSWLIDEDFSWLKKIDSDYKILNKYFLFPTLENHEKHGN